MVENTETDDSNEDVDLDPMMDADLLSPLEDKKLIPEDPTADVVDEFDETDFDEDFDDTFEEEVEGEYNLEDDKYGEEFDREFGHLTDPVRAAARKAAMKAKAAENRAIEKAERLAKAAKDKKK